MIELVTLSDYPYGRMIEYARTFIEGVGMPTTYPAIYFACGKSAEELTRVFFLPDARVAPTPILAVLRAYLGMPVILSMYYYENLLLLPMTVGPRVVFSAQIYDKTDGRFIWNAVSKDVVRFALRASLMCEKHMELYEIVARMTDNEAAAVVSDVVDTADKEFSDLTTRQKQIVGKRAVLGLGLVPVSSGS